MERENIGVFTMVFDKTKGADGKMVEDPVRAKLARKTITLLHEKRLDATVLYTPDCTDETIEVIKKYANGVVADQNGMGPTFMQGMRESVRSGAKYHVWMEVEKLPFVKSVEETAQPLIDGEADWVVPARNQVFDHIPLRRYPRFQSYTEFAGNVYLNHAIYGLDLDIEIPAERALYMDGFFGPDAIGSRAIAEIEKYNSSDFPGKVGQWDIHMVPMISAGIRLKSVVVDYMHPESQTKAENENYPFWCDKRIAQLQQLKGAIDGYEKVLYQA